MNKLTTECSTCSEYTFNLPKYIANFFSCVKQLEHLRKNNIQYIFAIKIDFQIFLSNNAKQL